MTQPALSNALSRLRLMMKDQLFIRERYGVPPTDLGTLPVEMAWRVRCREDPAHRRLRAFIAEVTKEVADDASAKR
jgi:hypothetical protein